MKHKHAELIHAWADGAKIQYLFRATGKWLDCIAHPVWDVNVDYRIKPEPKPDVVLYFYWQSSGVYELCEGERRYIANLCCIFDGETGKLVKAQVL